VALLTSTAFINIEYLGNIVSRLAKPDVRLVLQRPSAGIVDDELKSFGDADEDDDDDNDDDDDDDDNDNNNNNNNNNNRSESGKAGVQKQRTVVAAISSDAARSRLSMLLRAKRAVDGRWRTLAMELSGATGEWVWLYALPPSVSHFVRIDLLVNNDRDLNFENNFEFALKHCN
jgi:hypothetical protein